MSTTSRLVDRSVLRRVRREGGQRRDRRGRYDSAPAILHYGFRPFFLIAALHAALAVPLWLSAYLTGVSPSGPFSGVGWHAHEMLFGYVGAVVTGFILTAIPNWTGRLPLSGMPLAGLVGLWVLGRFACGFVASPVLAAALDLAFPATLAFTVWREVVAGRNWRNAPVAVLVTLFGIGNALHHAEGWGLAPEGSGIRMALGVITVLMALIGGRIVPSFTRNWLVKRGDARLPASFGRLDKIAVGATAASVLLWVTAPGLLVTGASLALAGGLLAVRLCRWRGIGTVREPILIVLHAGYAWLAVAVTLLGAAILWPAVPESAAIHALTAGAIGTMTLAVMTRASLGHTGRDIVADRSIAAIYVAVAFGAALRVAAPLSEGFYVHLLACGGTLWSVAFVLFLVRFAPMLFRPRLSG